MSSNNRVLIIGGNKKVLKKAKNLNIEIISIQKKSTFKDELLEYADITYQVDDYEDINSLGPLVSKIYSEHPFRCAISLTEYGLIPAAYVNEMLNLPGNPLKTVKLLKNKQDMRFFLNEKGISPVQFEVGTQLDDIKRFIDECNGNIIVKPIDGSGSLGIFKIENICDAELKWEQIKKVGAIPFIMEEYLDGPEISVEAFSFSGKHNIIAITDKLIQENFVEIGHCVPSNINPELKVEVEKLVKEFLSTIGLNNGPSHTEIKLTSKGPKIVESHNRIGGDSINELVLIANEIDMLTLTFQWAFGLSEPITYPIIPKRGSAIRFITPSAGIVKEINGVEEVSASPYIEEFKFDIKIGDEIQPLHHSLDRKGYIIARGEDSKEALANCNSLLSKIIVDTAI